MGRRLIAADVVGIVVAFAAAWTLGDAPLLFADATWEPFALLAGGIVAWVVAMSAGGIYRERPAGLRSLGADAAEISGSLTVAVWAICVASYLTGEPHPDVRQLLAFWAFGILAIAFSRQAARVGGQAAATPARAPRWVPALALTDAVVLLAVLTACWRLVDEPLPADSNAWAVVFVALGVPAWVAAATALGHYAPASLRDDVVATVVLASWGAWFLVALSPYTGEIDPDINQLAVVWTGSIAGVVTARRVVRRVMRHSGARFARSRA